MKALRTLKQRYNRKVQPNPLGGQDYMQHVSGNCVILWIRPVV